jgi:RNA polymerase sigma-70 factor (family 1)
LEQEILHNEKELLSLISEGDEGAFRKVYEHYWDRIYSISLLYLKSPLYAQDVVQEVFLKVWQNRNKLVSLNNFGAWLHVIARNLLINMLSRKAAGKKWEIGQTIDPADQSPVADEQMVQKEISVLIRKATESLPPQQQKIYRMGKEQGMKLTEVAKELNISHNTAREHMSKALKNIRGYLSERGDYWAVLVLLFMQG